MQRTRTAAKANTTDSTRVHATALDGRAAGSAECERLQATHDVTIATVHQAQLTMCTMISRS